MKKRLLLSLLLLPLVSFAQHTLKGTLSPAENYSWILMYQVTPTGKMYAKDAKVIDGKAQIKLDSTIATGMYRIVYAVPPEGNSFDFIYNGKEDIEFNFSATPIGEPGVDSHGHVTEPSEKETVVTFTTSEENKKIANYNAEMTKIKGQIREQYARGKRGMNDLGPIFALQKEVQDNYEKASKNMMAGDFISASRPFIPKKVVDAKTYFEKTKEQFFSHADVTSKTLQKSTYIYDRALAYITEKEDVDQVVNFLAPASPEFQKTILHELWKHAESSNDSDLANYITTKRLMILAKELKDTGLVNKIFKYQNLSIGATAPNFSWKSEDEKSIWLSDLEGSENYILVFWSSTCSHCLKELPKLQTAMDSIPESKYKVIAFGVEDDIYNWKNETLRLPKFMHIPGLGRWNNDVVKTYNVKKTPTYYMLDADKVITAKPDELDDVLKLLPNVTVEK